MTREFVGLSREKISDVVNKKLGDRRYDLMFLVDTGGTYILGSNEKITGRATKVVRLPLSGHCMKGEIPNMGKIYSAISSNAKEIVLGRKIAVVEGDVGPIGDSFNRLQLIKQAIRNLNKKAIVEIIVGVSETYYAKEGMFDIVGFVTNDLAKLSDIARLLMGFEDCTHSERKLMKYWKKSKLQ